MDIAYVIVSKDSSILCHVRSVVEHMTAYDSIEVDTYDVAQVKCCRALCPVENPVDIFRRQTFRVCDVIIKCLMSGTCID